MKYFLTYLFFLTLSLLFLKGQQPNDCANYIQVCGNQDISLDVSGAGTQEIFGFACSSNENNSLWLRVTIETAGTLGFTLTPSSTSINEDYDFFVFGPNVTCGNIGFSLRCSTTNPSSAGQGNNLTGMNGTETDSFEGPASDGNSFVRWLDVLPGETYFIVLDRPIGNSPFNLEWTGTALLENPLEDITVNTTINIDEICDLGNDGIEPYDFSIHNSEWVNDITGLAFTYYSSENNATISNNPINSGDLISDGTYWVRIENTATGCFEVASFEVELGGLPIRNDKLKACDIGNDGEEMFDLSVADIIDSPVNYSIVYYENKLDAINQGVNFIPNPSQYLNTNNSQIIYALITNIEGCSSIAEITLEKLIVPELSPIIDEYCDGDLANNQVDLTSYVNNILTNGNFALTFYASQTDLNNNTSINTPQSYQLNLGQNELYVTATNEICKTTETITITIESLPDLGQDEVIKICPEEFPYTLSVDPVFSAYIWSTAETNNVITITEVGEYIVNVENQEGCISSKTFTVEYEASPYIESIDIQGDNAIIVNAYSESSPVYYSLDGGDWQLENQFIVNIPGEHYVQVKLEGGCVSDKYYTYVFNINNVITPNNDGLNDTWNFPGLEKLEGVQIRIFDRYGKILLDKIITAPFSWDGTYLGRNLPSSDYWYIIDVQDGIRYTGNITIKNQ